MKNLLKLAVLTAALALSTGAYATHPGNNGNGNGGCGQGQQTNGCGGGGTPPPSGNPPPVYNGGGGGGGGNASANAGAIAGAAAGAIATGGNATGGNATGGNGYGGAGGEGGRGGSASILGSGNSSNTNVLGQEQGQIQGQAQGQIATSRSNSGGNILSNGSSSNSSSGATSNSGGNIMTGGANTSTQANVTEVHVEGDKVNYEAQKRNPVSTAYAPNIAPTATCMGSTSAGAQGIGFGVSFGSTWTDENCQTLEQVRTTATVLGDQTTAAEMMCAQIPKYREARQRAGKPCAEQQQAAAAPVAAPVVASAAPTVASAPAVAENQPAEKLNPNGTPMYTDPIIRARLGLPPLKQ